ncbi:hypothetical protein SJI00_00150 [Pseudomonas sp. RP23018S]|uniref:hypothetical protein n=1 Tax=Pseudomonas sp. RP23018S TaxID=3096037 RepID=UPI002ACA2F05|nr:hypothetical protein [Pseudomonas sp. RP23018S]MDZ5601199.1 hypothetical protein [Pseudomonas sp. RP23018S]
MATEHLGPEHYVEGRLVALILLVITGLGAFAATTFWGGRACAVAAQVIAGAVVVAVVLLAVLNRGAKRPKREGRSYLLTFVLALVWAGLATWVVVSQTSPHEEHLALLAGTLSGVLGGIAAAIAAHLWHEHTPGAGWKRPRRPSKAEQALSQVKARL